MVSLAERIAKAREVRLAKERPQRASAPPPDKPGPDDFEPRKDLRKIRKCLHCGGEFVSQGKGHRLCSSYYECVRQRRVNDSGRLSTQSLPRWLSEIVDREYERSEDLQSDDPWGWRINE